MDKVKAFSDGRLTHSLSGAKAAWKVVTTRDTDNEQVQVQIFKRKKLAMAWIMQQGAT